MFQVFVCLTLTVFDQCIFLPHFGLSLPLCTVFDLYGLRPAHTMDFHKSPFAGHTKVAEFGVEHKFYKYIPYKRLASDPMKGFVQKLNESWTVWPTTLS